MATCTLGRQFDTLLKGLINISVAVSLYCTLFVCGFES